MTEHVGPEVPSLPRELYDVCRQTVTKFRDCTVGREDNTQIMRFMEDISNAADAHGYQYTASWHCKQLGIHPGNRDGEGVKWRRSQTRIEKSRQQVVHLLF